MAEDKQNIVVDYEGNIIADWSPDMGIDQQKLVESYKWLSSQIGRPADSILSDPAGRHHVEVHLSYFEVRFERETNPVAKKGLAAYVAAIRRGLAEAHG